MEEVDCIPYKFIIKNNASDEIKPKCKSRTAPPPISGAGSIFPYCYQARAASDTHQLNVLPISGVAGAFQRT